MTVMNDDEREHMIAEAWRRAEDRLSRIRTALEAPDLWHRRVEAAIAILDESPSIVAKESPP
jgi:hypothetical protein